ncbi:MAG: DUF1049 domain-containing protein [Planctomycetes bacterium]|nr:DUF1049 domain-containing protein [Planctomycetota bacterium]
MKNWKLILIAAGLLFVAVAVIQNTEEVVTKLLIFEVRMPRAVLLFATFAVGFVVGVVVTLRAKRSEPARTEPTS